MRARAEAGPPSPVAVLPGLHPIVVIRLPAPCTMFLTLAVCLLVCAILSAVPTDVAGPPPCSSSSLALCLLPRPSSMTELAMSTNFSRPGESTRLLSCCASLARSWCLRRRRELRRDEEAAATRSPRLAVLAGVTLDGLARCSSARNRSLTSSAHPARRRLLPLPLLAPHPHPPPTQTRILDGTRSAMHP